MNIDNQNSLTKRYELDNTFIEPPDYPTIRECVNAKLAKDARHTMGVTILLESEVYEDIERLDRAWAAAETFALVPDKTTAGPAWIRNALKLLPPALAEGHFALLTSGSTGNPKLIIGERRRAEALARALDTLQLGSVAARTIVALPLSYCYAFVNQWLWARVNDRELLITAGFSKPEYLRDTLAQTEDAMLCLVGAQVPLLRRLMGNERYAGVVRLHFAGGRFPQEHLDYLSRTFPNALIFNNYGCAEAMPRLSLRQSQDAGSAQNIGHPLPGIEFSKADDGQLLFRSPYRAKAFVDENGLQLIGRDSWIETGDLAHQNDDETWAIEGRSNEVFKRYGEKVFVPKLLNLVTDTWEGQVASYRDRDGQSEDAWVLVLAPAPTDEQLRKILMSFRAHHARPVWPLRIEHLSEFPTLPNGKIDRQTLERTEGKVVDWRQRI